MEMEGTVQQVFKLLLAKQEEMLAKMKADREKIQTETEAIRAITKGLRGKRIANREGDREGPKGMMAEMNAKMVVNQEEL
jgi:hypothetical protein